MSDEQSTLSENEAIELLAYILSSTEGLLREPPHYAPLRMASVADRMAGMWAPRAGGEIGAFLHDLHQRMPVESAATQAGGDQNAFLKYLTQKIGELAVIVKGRNMAGHSGGA